jgi:hypothetical protein
MSVTFFSPLGMVGSWTWLPYVVPKRRRLTTKQHRAKPKKDKELGLLPWQHSRSRPTATQYRDLTITLRHTTSGRTPLDEWSARRRDLYLTTHNTDKRQTSMPAAGFEPTIRTSERPQTHALDRGATGTDRAQIYFPLILLHLDLFGCVNCSHSLPIILFIYIYIYIFIFIYLFIYLYIFLYIYVTFLLPCIVIDFFLNNQKDTLIIQIYCVINLYIFRASSLPIIRSFLLYIRHC